MKVEAVATIAATPQQVWDFITIPENGPRWQEGAVSTRVTTPGPVRVGSGMEHLGRWLWMRIPTTAIVTVYEPPSRYGYDISTKLARRPSLMRYRLDPVPGGTRLTLSNEAGLGGRLRPFEPLLERNVRGMFERDVARLKAIIEAEVGAAATHDR